MTIRAAVKAAVPVAPIVGLSLLWGCGPEGAGSLDAEAIRAEALAEGRPDPLAPPALPEKAPASKKVSRRR